MEKEQLWQIETLKERLRILFQRDMGGSLVRLMAKSRANRWQVDPRIISCFTYVESGHLECTVRFWSGLGGVRTFYKANKLRDHNEAIAHLDKEIVRASSLFPESIFLRSIRTWRGKQGLPPTYRINEWKRGSWIKQKSHVHSRLCKSCRIDTDEDFCPQCGEPLFL